jgi:hypothetical protein
MPAGILRMIDTPAFRALNPATVALDLAALTQKVLHQRPGVDGEVEQELGVAAHMRLRARKVLNEWRALASQRSAKSGVASASVQMRESGDHTPVAAEDRTSGGLSEAQLGLAMSAKAPTQGDNAATGSAAAKETATLHETKVASPPRRTGQVGRGAIMVARQCLAAASAAATPSRRRAPG